MPSSVLVFDIRTVPDVVGLRAIHALPRELSDFEVAEFAFQRRRAIFGADVLPAHLLRVVCISWLLRDDNGVTIGSHAMPDLDESDLLQTFLTRVADSGAALLSWDGRRRANPTLLTRALLHGVQAGYYAGALQERLRSLAEEMSVGERDSAAALRELALLSGFPAERSLGAEDIWRAHVSGDHMKIRVDCEQDVLKTWQLSLRRDLMHGVLDRDAYDQELLALTKVLTAFGGH